MNVDSAGPTSDGLEPTGGARAGRSAVRALERFMFSLRGPGEGGGGIGGHSPRVLLAAIVLAGAVYGGVMGTFQLTSLARLPLVAFSAFKVPILIVLTTAICLPAYFVLNTILGLREDFPRALRAVLIGQTAQAIALASLAPLVLVAYASGVTHGQAQLASALNFLLATGVGQVVLIRHYRVLIREDGEMPRAAGRGASGGGEANGGRGAKHRIMLWTWVVIYAFVGIQLGWILRPYIGVPGLPVQFFREDAFSNAYVYFLRLILRGG